MLIMPADPDKNYFKRDIALIVKGLKDELKKDRKNRKSKNCICLC